MLPNHCLFLHASRPTQIFRLVAARHPCTTTTTTHDHNHCRSLTSCNWRLLLALLQALLQVALLVAVLLLALLLALLLVALLLVVLFVCSLPS
jgi:hypothetical protein